MSVDPEFKKVLDAASENAFKMLSSGAIDKQLAEKVRKIDERVTKIKRDADAIRRKARSRMAGARALAMGRGIPIPDMSGMSPEDIRAYAKQLREENLRRRNPYLNKIERQFIKQARVVRTLVCPECGDGDHGNRKNKIPWCLKCNAPLLKPGRQVENWNKHSIKRVG